MPSSSAAFSQAAADFDRRCFLAAAGLAAGTAAVAPASAASLDALLRIDQDAQPDEAAAPAGVSVEAIAQAEKLLGLTFTDKERDMMRPGLEQQVEFWQFLRDLGLQNNEAPAEVFDPRMPGETYPHNARRSRFAPVESTRKPDSATDLAFAPASQLAHLLRTRQLSSVEITELCLNRLKEHGPTLECVVTLTEELAMDQARQADRERSQGKVRSPLHGIPFGLKDLFDTAGIRTTWGAAPYKDRVPDRDSAVYAKLRDAGAVLCAKLTLGALAYGDIWFGGRTKNPWNLKQGSSGSSAGSAASAAAGLLPVTMGTETYGSIGSPSARCGATGLRPTFGRISRAGAMALCWTLDKAGPLCRTVDDCALALDVLNGADPADPASRDVPLNLDMTRSIKGVRVGYDPREYDSDAATDADRHVLDILRDRGCKLVELELPRSREFGGVIFLLISVEAACAFDELTRSNQDDLMQWQSPQAWPNTFRMARFYPAVEHLMASRLRRRYMQLAHELFSQVEVITAPQRHGALHAITNMTGHPAITQKHGFRDNGTPRGFTMWGRLYDERTLLAVARAVEQDLGLWTKRPPLFS